MNMVLLFIGISASAHTFQSVDFNERILELNDRIKVSASEESSDLVPRIIAQDAQLLKFNIVRTLTPWTAEESAERVFFYRNWAKTFNRYLVRTTKENSRYAIALMPMEVNDLAPLVVSDFIQREKMRDDEDSKHLIQSVKWITLPIALRLLELRKLSGQPEVGQEIPELIQKISLWKSRRIRALLETMNKRKFNIRTDLCEILLQ